MELWRALYPAAVAGDPAAVDRFLRVEERISQLLGLDLRPQGNGDGRAQGAKREDRVLVND